MKREHTNYKNAARTEFDCKPLTKDYDQNKWVKIYNFLDKLSNMFGFIDKDSQMLIARKQAYLKEWNKQTLMNERLIPYYYSILMAKHLRTPKTGVEIPNFLVKQQIEQQAIRLAENEFYAAKQRGVIDDLNVCLV